jgi:uncharacterized protein YcbK (DUF882 family)
MTTIDWLKYPNFSRSEFQCSHTGEAHMQPVFLDALQAVRTALDAPIIITSGYRHPTHPIEAAKGRPGEHTTGMAADVAVAIHRRVRLLKLALDHGFDRIGVDDTFIHLGLSRDFPRPRLWSYS